MRGQKLALALRLVGIGWFVAMCIGGGAVGGLLLDRQLETGPILTLVGLCAGIAVAVVGMYRMLMAILNSPREEQPE